MDDDKKEVSERILSNLKKIQESKGGRCEGCGYESRDADFFECEFCGGQLCTYCDNMTDDFKFICRECIKSMDLTVNDLQFEVDGAGRSFF